MRFAVSRRLLAAGALASLPLPALAHPGSHDGLGLEALLAHLATPWHALPLAGAALFTAILVARVVRRAKEGHASARGRRERP